MSLMPQTPFQWFVPATTGTGLVPAAGYFAKFYAAGTTDPKTIYTDPNLTVPFASPGNIAVLDAQGRSLIYLGAGGYKLVICKPDDTPIYEQDNISGESSFGTGFVNSFADLAGVNTTLNKYTYIGGYYIPGDGGEGMFYNDTSSVAADGGYVQASTFDITKRWFRIPDENGDVRAASFGFCASGDKTNELLAADYYASTIGARLRIQVDPCTATSVTLNAPTIVFNQDAALYAGSGTPALVINGIVEAGAWKIFSEWTSVTLANPSQESNPYWFGGSPLTTAAENTTAFAKWLAAGAGLFILPGGDWKYTGSFTPSSTKPTRFDGQILSGDGPTVGTYQGLFYPGSFSRIQAGIFALPNNALLVADDGFGIQTTDAWTVLGTNKGQAGVGGQYYRVGGTIGRYTSTSATGTAFTGSITNLYSLVIPANTLIAVGDSLTIKVQGWTTGDMSSNLGNVNIALGSTTITTDVFIYLSKASAGGFSGECTLVRTSLTTAQAYFTGICVDGVTTPFSVGNVNTSPITIPSTGWDVAQTLNVTGQIVTGSGRAAYLQFVDVSYSGIAS